MKQTERKRLLNRSREQLVIEIDELRDTVKRWKDMYQPSEVEAPPFYWMIGYFGWGSAEDDVDFINGGDENPTPQAAVDAWEGLREKGHARAHDEAHYHENPQLLVYRIDEVGNAKTDRRWVFKAS